MFKENIFKMDDNLNAILDYIQLIKPIIDEQENKIFSDKSFSNFSKNFLITIKNILSPLSDKNELFEKLKKDFGGIEVFSF